MVTTLEHSPAYADATAWLEGDGADGPHVPGTQRTSTTATIDTTEPEMTSAD